MAGFSEKVMFPYVFTAHSRFSHSLPTVSLHHLRNFASASDRVFTLGRKTDVEKLERFDMFLTETNVLRERGDKKKTPGNKGAFFAT